MDELRWILLGLGVLLIAGLYFWGRRPLPKLRLPLIRSGASESTSAAERPEALEPLAENPKPKPKPRRRTPEKVVTLRVVCRHQDDMNASEAVLALKRVGLVHGKYGIFHRYPDDGGEEALYSVASLTEPGSFDLEALEDSSIAGLSLFMVIPGPGDPVRRFDAMLELARALAEELDGLLLDERGSSWSIQRERYIREDIIQFQHHLSRA